MKTYAINNFPHSRESVTAHAAAGEVAYAGWERTDEGLIQVNYIWLS